MKIVGLSKGCVVFVVLFVVSGCALMTGNNYSSVDALKGSVTQKSLTKEAFKQVEPMIGALYPNQPMHTTFLTWQFNSIWKWNREVGIFATSPGWAGNLSGGTIGAYSMLGEVYAIKDGSIYGVHFYGYLDKIGVFHTRFLVHTTAKIISESEYKSLEAEKVPDIGRYKEHDETGEGIAVKFKNLKIASVETISPGGKGEKTYQTGKAISFEEAMESQYSKKRYEHCVKILSELPKGIGLYEVMRKLDGVIVSNNGGETFILYMLGYSNYKNNYYIFRIKNSGMYSVWPFGYLEMGKEVPKKALIFKNGYVYKVLPYKSKAQILSNLD